MKSSHVFFVTALAFVPVSANAQSAKETFSYSAPSGMFDNGSFQTNMYRFMAEDAERTAKLREGQDVSSTGSVSSQGSATGPEEYRRPGERNRRRASDRR